MADHDMPATRRGGRLGLLIFLVVCGVALWYGVKKYRKFWNGDVVRELTESTEKKMGSELPALGPTTRPSFTRAKVVSDEKSARVVGLTSRGAYVEAGGFIRFVAVGSKLPDGRMLSGVYPGGFIASGKAESLPLQADDAVRSGPPGRSGSGVGHGGAGGLRAVASP